ncbi:MAG: type II toxin-antitoxin system VapB family antitoxin [Bryobacteraceae bacterium]
MRRTNLVLDGDRLEEARRLLGSRTYSDTVNQALQEAIRIARLRTLPDLLAKVSWDGDIAEMRDDRPHAPRSKKHRAG